MTTIVPAHAPASWSLSQINQYIRQEESKFGPLVSMTFDTATSVFSFDIDQPNPAVYAVVAGQVGGAPVIPAGSTLVCQGSVFISGTLQLAAATRG
jgi:hypothetical protein